MQILDRVADRGIRLPLIGLIVFSTVALIIHSLTSRPQIGPDPDVFKTVDALFTAINSRNKPQLEDCKQRIQGYRQAGKLPAAAASRLDSIILQADAGQWQASSRILYDFMLAQRGLN